MKIKHLTVDDAITIESNIRNDLQHINSNTCYYLIFTFKSSYLRNIENNYPERLEEVRKCLEYSFRCSGGLKNNIRKKDRIYFLKDEVSPSGNFHVHALVDLYRLKRKGVPIEWFFAQVNNYWSSPFLSYEKNCSWEQLRKRVTEPRCGWFKDVRPKYDSRTLSDNRLTLFNYQTKAVKDIYDDEDNYLRKDIVSNCQYHCSYGLYTSLDILHSRYRTENLYLKIKRDVLI